LILLFFEIDHDIIFEGGFMENMKNRKLKLFNVITFFFLLAGIASSGFAQYQTIDESYTHPRIHNPEAQIYYHKADQSNSEEPAKTRTPATRSCLKKCSLKCIDHRVGEESFGDCASNCDKACSL